MTAAGVGLALSRRLERTEAQANRAFVESRARRVPALGATWRDVDGTWAMFDGVGSPCTQSFGFGLFSEPTAAQLEILEAFFSELGADLVHEVSPLAEPAVLERLGERGYRPVALTTVLYRWLDREAPASGTPILVRPIAVPAEADAWAETAAAGWTDTPEAAQFMRDFARVGVEAAGSTSFVAELEGAVIATGAMMMHGGTALLAGASTVPAWRGRGAQRALLAGRLAYARAAGCDLAVMGAAPGSTSQLNAERQGFRIAYTRIQWRRG